MPLQVRIRLRLFVFLMAPAAAWEYAVCWMLGISHHRAIWTERDGVVTPLWKSSDDK
jgi:hypothetical protein